jgi:chorismate mutase/prephenate dehydrogenase
VTAPDPSDASDASETPDASDPIPPDLIELRRRIDAIDHELVELLARRNDVVREVAAVKRQSGFPIRDAGRETALLNDRAALATRRDLRPEVVESLFRVVLWASRDRQASLGASMPRDLPRRRVAVIGAAAGIGRLFATLFEEFGQTVLRVDRDTSLDAATAAADADVVMVAVPIDATTEVIARVGPALRPGGLLLDVTSVKAGPVAAMLDATEADVIGTHPLFGPSVHSLQGQRIVLCPARVTPDHGWDRWLRGLLGARGLVSIDTDPAHHDRVMSVVQVLTHHATEVLGLTLARLGVPVDETLRFTSPVYLMELMMSARHFAQSADLYRAIQTSNPETERVMSTFRAAAADLAGAIGDGDAAAFARLFEEPREAFGDFSGRALETSSFLIDRLVERTD